MLTPPSPAEPVPDRAVLQPCQDEGQGQPEGAGGVAAQDAGEVWGGRAATPCAGAMSLTGGAPSAPRRQCNPCAWSLAESGDLPECNAASPSFTTPRHPACAEGVDLAWLGWSLPRTRCCHESLSLALAAKLMTSTDSAAFVLACTPLSQLACSMGIYPATERTPCVQSM